MPFCRLDAQALVGLLGRSDSLQIRGNHDVSEKDIRKALMRSPDFLIAAHPKAPREAFLKATARLTQAGYLAHGHPEGRVVATLSEDKENVHIEVHEGPLYYCGPVQVQGAIDIPVDSLVNALSEKPSDPQSDEELPWEAGEPAPFDEASRKRLHQWVAEKLHALGFFASVVEVEPRVIEDSDKAVLIIRILKEGQKIMLGDIRVEGNHRFSKEDIIRLSGLHEASLLSQKVLEKAKHRLKASQRFLGCQVSSEDAPDEGRGNLLIRVREYDKAPDIGQPWHEKDRIIL
ncbi:MAG: POTRA domain-containing protein, partial [Verrucomicrobiales bacterium]